MSAGWVAGSVRAWSLSRHRLGIDATRAVAAGGSRAQAEAMLGATPYARAVVGAMSVADVQRAIWATALWDMRILAGWIPPDGVEAARTFAGFFEIQNAEDVLAPPGGNRPAPFDLGGLATIRAHAAAPTSAHELREQLRYSSWRDPGTDDPGEMLAALRLEWARRLTEVVPAAAWGPGEAAILAARSLAEHARPLDAATVSRIPGLGRRVAEATTLPDLVSALGEQSRWALEGIEHPQDLWRAEARWWRRVDADGTRMLRAARPGLGVVVGALAVRMADAWRTSAALEIASRAGRGAEVLDAVA